uniref:Reverse transcriptase zinc-binding domain-containing protein n=1 Tax=Populus alba TaxID=43335 RepID=A0A4V6A7E0_POPAL|nr:hypothetical protein D5086_0000200720 [Populus alba]
MEDHHLSKGNSSGQFTIDSAWELLRDTGPANTIHHLLWFKCHIRRQSFILWLASQGRLRSMDRLHITGSITNTTCILCGPETENHDHLLFRCSYSGTVWGAVTSKSEMQWPNLPCISFSSGPPPNFKLVMKSLIC